MSDVSVSEDEYESESSLGGPRRESYSSSSSPSPPFPRVSRKFEFGEEEKWKRSVPRTVPCIVLSPPEGITASVPPPAFSFPLPHEALAKMARLSQSIFNSDPSTPDSIKMGEKEERSQKEKNEIVVQPSKKLTFGIDRILADDKISKDREPRAESPLDLISKSHGHENHPGLLAQCSECFILSRYCRRLQMTPPASSPYSWHPPHGIYDNSNTAMFPQNGYLVGHPHVGIPSYGLGGSNYSAMSSMVSCNTSGGGRRKRSWSRAVFSNLQRKGLEKRFQIQKYITKPDRRQLAATLGLTDAQVKVWFQNRRMKWRHSKEGKQGIDDSSQTLPIEKKL